MDVSVIIVNYNTHALTIQCIHSIYKKTEGVSFEIIVADNASSDGSVDILKNEFGEKITILPLPRNIGFGRANNKGMEVAKGRNIFFLNPDTLLINNAISYLSDFLDQNERVGGCGGNIYDGELNPSHSFARMFPSISWELNELLYGTLGRIIWGRNCCFNFTDKEIAVAYITGADLMIKRSVLSLSGLFSDDFFMYFEETDLCRRINKLGYQIISLPRAHIQHFEGASFSTGISSHRIIFTIVSRDIFYKKYYSFIYILFVNLICLCNLLSRNFLSLFFRRKENKYWRMRLSYFIKYLLNKL